MITRIIIFLVLNFSALGLGVLLSGNGSQSDWYQSLNIAPWTPPGWVFGAAWFTIMVCFTFYMSFLWELKEQQTAIIILFVLQWILNTVWNPVFFKYEMAMGGLILITLLAILITYLFFKYLPDLRYASILILPYFIWLWIAVSLNAYVVLNISFK